MSDTLIDISKARLYVSACEQTHGHLTYMEVIALALQEADKLRTALDAVRKLPESWRDWNRTIHQKDSPSIAMECAQDLDALLDPI